MGDALRGNQDQAPGAPRGGPKSTEYSYFANFAIAVAEGEISHVRRIWADGKEFDQHAPRSASIRATISSSPIRSSKPSKDAATRRAIAVPPMLSSSGWRWMTTGIAFRNFSLRSFGLSEVSYVTCAPLR